ncbi:MAG: hypothetical protein AB1656_14840 [Candidatus Omnitrophota bacterium]
MRNDKTLDKNSSFKGEAAKAALLSALVLPGAGQMYNRQWIKGLFLGLLFLAASLAVLIPLTLAAAGYYLALNSESLDSIEKSLQPIKDMMLSLIVLAVSSIVLYVYSIVDAYAQRMRMEKEASQNDPEN